MFILTKIRIVAAMGFPVTLYESKSWILKKQYRKNIGGFKLWVLEKTPEKTANHQENKQMDL